MSDYDRDPSDPLDAIDEVFLAAAPLVPSHDAVERLAACAISRYARRRRTVRLVAWSVGLASAAGVALSLTLIPWTAQKRDEESNRPVDVVAAPPKVEEETPRHTPRPGGADEEPYARQVRAIRALAAYSIERAVQAYWTECSRSASMQDFVAATLPRIEEPIVAGLAGAVRRGAWPGERQRAARKGIARGLVESGASEIWPLLAAMLERWGPVDGIARAAGEFGDVRAVALLERWINAADERALAAIDALERMQRAEALRPLVDLFERSSLVSRLLSPERRDFLAAVLRRNEHIVILILDEDCRSPRLCQGAVSAFATLFPEAAYRCFARQARTAAPATRAWIFQGLVMLGTDDAVGTLIACLHDSELAAVARVSLTRVAKRDLGPRPEAWKRYFSALAAKAARTTLRALPGRNVFMVSSGRIGKEKNV